MGGLRRRGNGAEAEESPSQNRTGFHRLFIGQKGVGREAFRARGEGVIMCDLLKRRIAIFTKLLKAKIHHATVTQTDPNYHGSITIDTDILAATGLLPNEAVTVADCENGNRFETYIIPGEAGSGVIGINGAAALLSACGHRVIVMAFQYATPEEVKTHKATVAVLDKKNRVAERFEQKTML